MMNAIVCLSNDILNEIEMETEEFFFSEKGVVQENSWPWKSPTRLSRDPA